MPLDISNLMLVFFNKTVTNIKQRLYFSELFLSSHMVTVMGTLQWHQ